MRLCFCVLLVVLMSVSTRASDFELFGTNDLQLTDSQSKIRLNPQFKIFSEDSNPLTLEQIKQRQHEFRWPRGNSFNYGHAKNAIWLYTSFSNVTDNDQWVIDIGYPHLEEVSLYLLQDGKILKGIEQDKYHDHRQVRYPTMRVSLPFATKVELFIRVKSPNTSLLVPVDIQSEAMHAKQLLNDSLLWGIFYGGLIVLIAYNLFLYKRYSDLGHLAFIGYALGVILWRFVWGGHAALYFSPDWTLFLDQHKASVLALFGIGFGGFSLAFLEGKKTAPKLSPVIIGSMLLVLVLGLLELTNILSNSWSMRLMLLASFMIILSASFAGFESYLNRFKAAKLYILGWAIVAVTAFVSALTLINVIAPSNFTAYSFSVGVFVQACLFSLAMMEKTRHQLQSEVNQASQDLHNNMVLVEEQNARLEIARKDALQASNIKSQFLANMSHEIRTPLNAILGFSNELKHASVTEDEKEQLTLIHAAADTLLDTVNDILDFSKIEAGKLSINSEPFSPAKLVEEVVVMMSRGAQAKGLNFIFDLAPIPEKFLGDPFRIKQVLNNLLSNALKFTNKGHIRLAISAKEIEANLYELQICVEDTGIGISQQDRKKLFSAFSQVEEANTRNYQGTGLGLVICQELIKLMHGQLELSSQPGQGSTFLISLPLTPISQRKYPRAQETWLDRLVLLYDPYPASRETTAGLLNMLGAKVTAVESLRKLAEEKGNYHMLMASLQTVPGMHNDEVLPILGQIKADKRFILHSGKKPLESLSQTGIDGQIKLPLTPGRLEALQQGNGDPESSDQQILASLPAIRILAVDDMPMNLHLLKTWLDKSPVTLDLAHSGEDAVNLCEQHSYDLVLMDIQMPMMDGVEASQKIRQTSENTGTPIIAVTAHAFKEEQDRLLSSGMDDYLPKPIHLPDLVKLIQLWCHMADHETEHNAIDWQMAMNQANQAEETATELLNQFTTQLPEMLVQIASAWDSQDFAELKALIHKLHGACHYTGVPQLRQACSDFEIALKQQQSNQSHFDALSREATRVIEQSQEVLTGG